MGWMYHESPYEKGEGRAGRTREMAVEGRLGTVALFGVEDRGRDRKPRDARGL